MPPLASPRYLFKQSLIVGAPKAAGVYALFWGDELLFVGAAHARATHATVRAALLAHLYGECAPDVATHYKWELCADPEARQREILKSLKRPPRFNASA